MTSDMAGRLSAWLITFAIHSTFLIGLGALLARECRRRGAISHEEAVWRLALLGAPVTATVQAFISSAWLPGAGTVHPLIMTLPGLSRGVTTAGAGLPDRTWPTALLMVLATATLLRFARWCLERRRLDAFLRSRRPAPSWMRRMVDELADASGSGVRAKLSVHPELPSPVAFGLLRPEITVPHLALAEGPDAIRPMLAHEVAHIRDHDPLWRALLDLMEVLFPWQLLLLPVRRRLEVISDLRCDSRAALWAGARPMARSLVAAAGWVQASEGRPVCGVETFAGPGSLERRVDRLLAGSHQWNGPGVGFIAILLLSLGALGPALPGASAARVDDLPAGSVVAPELPALPDPDTEQSQVTAPGPGTGCHGCAARKEPERPHEPCSGRGCKHARA